MRYRVGYSARAQKDIAKLVAPVRTRLGRKLQYFYEQSDPLDFAEPLTKPADAQYRFRVGDYRVLFDVDGDTIKVLRVQHRREVYQR